MPEKAVFDDMAEDYDTAFSETLVGKSQRSEVWFYLNRYVELHSKKILELGCGTGVDALLLAEMGNDVLATDVSSRMLSVADFKEKKGSIVFEQLDARNLEKLNSQKFDLIFSNFGALNFLSGEELKKLAQELKYLLNPGGKLVLVFIHSYSFWELFYFGIRFRWKSAVRRLRGKAEFRNRPVYYYSHWEIRKAFSGFHLKNSEPIGILTPPSYDEKFLRWLGGKPRIQKKDRMLERFCARIIGADHYFYLFENG